MKCVGCESEKSTSGNRPPRGWKNHNGIVYCSKCWSDRYVLRAISIPVVRPLGEGVGWPQLREALREAWGLATGATNLSMSLTFAADTHRTPDQKKIGKKPKTYNYPAIRSAFPSLPSQSAASITNTVEAKYRNKRYAILWTGEESLPSARYPSPYPLPNQAWKPIHVKAGMNGGDEVPCVSVALPGGRFLLQLRGGLEFKRQLFGFGQLISGEAIKGELSILRKRTDDSRNGTMARDSGGQHFSTRVIVKMAGWFPRVAYDTKSGVLLVRTAADCLLVALDEREKRIRTWNCDHLKRWTREHSHRLQRMSDDQKAEQRPVASFQSRREYSALKFRNRIDSLIKETCAQIAGVAKRTRVAEVRYDDSVRSYVESFRWASLRSRLAIVLDEIGVRLSFASGDVPSKGAGPLAETEGVS